MEEINTADKNLFGEKRFSSGDVYKGGWAIHLDKNVMQGNGVMQYANGDRYEGEWNCGKQDGYGTLISKNGSKYVGYWENGLRDGRGTQIYSNNCKYIGEWKENKPHGFGIMLYSNGFVYEGNFEFGERSGKGKLICQQETYDGDWQLGKKHGYGIITYPDGTIYKGYFKNGKKHGFGKLIKGENTLNGIWLDNELQKDGFIEIIFYNKDFFSGYIKDGQLNGKGVMNYNNGEKIEGNWLNSEPFGYCVVYKQDSIVSGKFENGKLNGQVTTNYNNGDACINIWVNGVPDSEVKFYYANGDAFSGKMDFFKKEKIFGTLQVKDGITYEGEFLKDSITGNGCMYYPNGTKYTGYFIDGKLEHGVEERPNGEAYKIKKVFGNLFYKKTKIKKGNIIEK